MKAGPDTTVLTVALQAAVPLWMMELGLLAGPARAVRARQWAQAAADEVAHRGDVLQYGGKPGQAATVFNALARGLAAAALQPGGVSFAGLHWCSAGRCAAGATCTAPGGYPADEPPLPLITVELPAADVTAGPAGPAQTQRGTPAQGQPTMTGRREHPQRGG